MDGPVIMQYTQNTLRTLFKTLIKSYPDCPKDVVIGKLTWQWLAPSCGCDEEARNSESLGKCSEAVGLSKEYALDDSATITAKTNTNTNTNTNTVIANTTAFSYEQSIPKSVDYNKKAFWLTMQACNMQLSELVQRIQRDTSDYKTSLSVECKSMSSASGEGIKPLVISKEEILDFVFAVEDENLIHRNAPYVVPGCLLLEKLLLQCIPQVLCKKADFQGIRDFQGITVFQEVTEFQATTDLSQTTIQKVDMKFRAPVHANEELVFELDETDRNISAKVENKIVFTAKLTWKS